jgi:hypothetical protein
MKFLCVECDERMEFADREVPGDGTLAAVFECPSCGRATGLLTNPMETQLVSSLGVKIGGRTVESPPMENTRSGVATGRDDAFDDEAPARATEASAAGADAHDGSPEPGDSRPERTGSVEWTPEAVDRLQRVPSFVRGMVRRIYTDWAKDREIEEITPEIMDRARSDLGLEGM